MHRPVVIVWRVRKYPASGLTIVHPKQEIPGYTKLAFATCRNDWISRPPPNLTVRFDGIPGSFGLAMGILGRQFLQNTNLGSTKLASYAAKAYD